MKKISSVFFYIGLVFLLSACGTDAAGNIESGAEETNKSDVIADKESVKEDASGAENSMGNDGNAVAEDGTDSDAGEYSVVYYWNNEEMDARARSGRIAEDWNGDGTEDVLNIDVTEQEGSEIIEKLELNMSGSDAPYVIRNQAYYFLNP